MTRATTRSQRRTTSQAPPRPSQSQRTRQARRNEESEGEEIAIDEGEEDENYEDANAHMDVGDGHDNDIRRKANELVRLALFTERRRMHLRREDVTKKVLGPNTRTFNAVFEHAQETLRKTFGMELVELSTRAGLDADSTDPANQQDELNQARNATGLGKKAAAVGSKTYILRSTLDPKIIHQASWTDEQILEEETAGLLSDSDDDEDTHNSRHHGSIISWGSSDQLGAIGILYTILALILVSGRVLNDMELRMHLKHLKLSLTSNVPFTPQSTQKSQSLSSYLSTLIRQGYLERVQVGDIRANKGKGKAGGGAGHKRTRVTPSQANHDDDTGADATYEWRWGNRAQSEVGEKAVAEFIAEFMLEGELGNDIDEDEEELGGGRRRRVRAGRAEDEEEKMMKGIERAAGGQLADIR